jgi:hypothetical protein
MKYYNNELDQRESGDVRGEVIEILKEVQDSIKQSLELLKQSRIRMNQRQV